MNKYNQLTSNSPADAPMINAVPDRAFDKMIGRVMEIIDINSDYPEQNAALKKVIKRSIREVQNEFAEYLPQHVWDALKVDGLQVLTQKNYGQPENVQ